MRCGESEGDKVRKRRGQRNKWESSLGEIWGKTESEARKGRVSRHPSWKWMENVTSYGVETEGGSDKG